MTRQIRRSECSCTCGIGQHRICHDQQIYGHVSPHFQLPRCLRCLRCDSNTYSLSKVLDSALQMQNGLQTVPCHVDEFSMTVELCSESRELAPAEKNYPSSSIGLHCIAIYACRHVRWMNLPCSALKVEHCERPCTETSRIHSLAASIALYRHTMAPVSRGPVAWYPYLVTMCRSCLRIFPWVSHQLTATAVRRPSPSAQTAAPSLERVGGKPPAPSSRAQTLRRVRTLLHVNKIFAR